jgi:hypothetical protein
MADDELFEQEWRNYQEVNLVKYPSQALSKREFIAGMKRGQALRDEEYQNALEIAEGSAENMLRERDAAERVASRLEAKLEAISKLCFADTVNHTNVDASTSRFWEGYESLQDLILQIIESPEEA